MKYHLVPLFLIFWKTSVSGQDCSNGIADNKRIDCSPWSGTTQASCEARGCVWCPHETQGIPWCFVDASVCPSTIPTNQRQDCHPEAGASRESCNARGCVWCESPGAPYCFSDLSISQGGELCPPAHEISERIDCHPEPGASADRCTARGCYWCSTTEQGAPWCFMPESQGYSMVGGVESTAKGYRVNLVRKNTPSWYGSDIASIRVDVEFQDNNRIRIKIYDPNTNRYEVPLQIESPDNAAPNPNYEVEFSDSPAFNIKVRRKATGTVLFDTSMGGLIFSDQFIQFSTKLPSYNLYGFGETEHHSLRHDMSWKSWGMFARDQPVMQGNLYGVHPFYQVVETDGNAHGVLILNSNAQDVTTMPTPGLLYRTIGGILDIYMFMGPTPENVIQQYTHPSVIGRPVMPPYWALGFHLCRYGYNTLDNMKTAVNRMRQYDIPHDVQYGDIDVMRDNLDFTYDTSRFAGLPQYIQELKQQGTRYITILDPCIDIGQQPGTYPPFDRGMTANVWMKEYDGVTNAEGKVWPPNNVYFPDYSKPSAQNWWIDETVRFKQVLDVDGLWIDMNEPANFVGGSVKGCRDNNINRPLYRTKILGDELYDKTACMDYRHTMGEHYNVHNLFGWSQGEPSLRAARAMTGGKRSVVISRSTFPGVGKYVSHWLGDNHANWNNMHYSIIGSLEFNMFGFPFVGPDICGFLGDSNEALCRRWMQLGAFYTFSRNHNGLGWQDHDPGYWPSVADASKKALDIRYTLLPYLYTLFHHAHAYGNTVMRPLFHEFYNDPFTLGIDRQFLWGPAFLITPVLDEGANTVSGYFPPASRWYSYYDGVEVLSSGWVPLSANQSFIPLHIRGGYILPTQQPANSTMFSRSNPMGLIVALDDNYLASGSLFWDEGDTVDSYETGVYFEARYTVETAVDMTGQLRSEVLHNGYSGVNSLYFGTFRVLGLDINVEDVYFNNIRINDWNQDVNGVLEIYMLTAVNSDFRFDWE